MQVKSSKSLESSDKESPSIKNFISERMVTPEVINKLENKKLEKKIQR